MLDEVWIFFSSFTTARCSTERVCVSAAKSFAGENFKNFELENSMKLLFLPSLNNFVAGQLFSN